MLSPRPGDRFCCCCPPRAPSPPWPPCPTPTFSIRPSHVSHTFRRNGVTDNVSSWAWRWITFTNELQRLERRGPQETQPQTGWGRRRLHGRGALALSPDRGQAGLHHIHGRREGIPGPRTDRSVGRGADHTGSGTGRNRSCSAAGRGQRRASLRRPTKEHGL